MRCLRVCGSLVLGCILFYSIPTDAQVVRTGDAAVRGLREADFPRIHQLAENVYAYEELNGPASQSLSFTTNSLIVVTSEGVLVADGQGSVAKTERLVEEIARITPLPIRYMVICADHRDHIAGNSAFPDEVTFIAHPTSKAVIERQQESGRGPSIPIPQETVSDRRVLTMGDTVIEILFLGRAHTGGDLQVFLPEENILFMGETFFNRIYPSVGGGMTAYPSEWLESVKRAEAMNADWYLADHGFVDPPDVMREELENFRRALENLISEATRLHDDGVPVERAFRLMNLGEFQYWFRAAMNMPDAVRQVYRELDGELD